MGTADITRRLRRLLVLLLAFWTLAAAAVRPVRADDDDLADARRRMVEEQIHARGVTDPAVLAALGSVPRHLFVPEDERAQAYADRPLPIGSGQTISQPYIVGLMTSCWS